MVKGKLVVMMVKGRDWMVKGRLDGIGRLGGKGKIGGNGKIGW